KAKPRLRKLSNELQRRFAPTQKNSSRNSAQQSRTRTRKEQANLATGLLFDFDGTLYGDWRLWISIIEGTLSDFKITITPHDALEMARRMIENGGNAKSTISISSIAAALAKDRGMKLPEEEVRTRFVERLDARMHKTIGLPQGFFTGQELEKAGADRILGSLELLPTMVYK